jgi:deoxyribose-phosphate aldolase
MEAGADFIKTSTGKFYDAATPEAVCVMCQAIADYNSICQRQVGIKPSGGISTTDEALIYYNIVKQTLGSAWLNNSFFRIGASRLANNLLTDITGLEAKYF